MSGPVTIDATIRARQRTASDPAGSAWVSANAGSGKTFVLARRVIRLLLEGVNPSKILCLTFTKAAAAEMSIRVFRELGKWTTMSDTDLAAALSDLGAIDHSPPKRAAARRLFARALETPGGLKIQTIHAFCERLLHQFPVEANVAGHFEMLDDAGRAHLIREVGREVLSEIARNPKSERAEALAIALSRSTDSAYEKAIAAFLARQQDMIAWVDAAGGVAAAVRDLSQYLGLSDNDTPSALCEEILQSPFFTRDFLEALLVALKAKSTFASQRENLETIQSDAPLAARIAAYQSFFLTEKGEARAKKSFIASDIYKQFGDLETRLADEQARLLDLIDRINALETVHATSALLTLGYATAKTYQAKKMAAGLLDFDDLIEKAASLLEKPDAAAWVHYKLDQGLDHILVDEAQDTSPRQWDVIRKLADEFYVGRSAVETRRTLFAVGDEKQSIYSFQGASPEKFSEMRRHFADKAEKAAQPFNTVPLTVSFRSTADVLGAVDRVFASEAVALAMAGAYQDHTAARMSQPGFVELWKPFAKPETKSHDGDWSEPLDTLGATSSERQLALRLAASVRAMVEDGTRLEATGKRIRYGDILILTRKRGVQVDEISRALKAAGIPVAGADRLKLTDHIAILDLLALTDFVLLSEDDLALAGVLKSPLIGLSEDDLFTLAHDRTGTLWNALYIRAQKAEAPFAEAHALLDGWRRAADFAPPFDFFLEVLARDKGRARFLDNLGSDTEEVLEAFLAQVQTFERTEAPTLQGFVAWFRNSSVEIKRDMETSRDEVRIMTVHGAKGLEAPVVFLIDGGKPYSTTHHPEIVGLGGDGKAPFLWKRPKEAATTAQNRSLERVKQLAVAEFYRLLYVAMTRTADRLYVLSSANAKGEVPSLGWYDVIQSALRHDPLCREVTDKDGTTTGWRFQISAPIERAEVAEDKAPMLQSDMSSDMPGDIPDWLSKPAPPPPRHQRRLAPSRSGGDDEVREGPPVPPVPLPSGHDADHVDPALRGVLMHRLLERLPRLPRPRWEDVADAFLAGSLAETAGTIRAAIAAEVIGVLDHPEMAGYLAAPTVRTEVPIAGHLQIGDETVIVRGNIDRLVVSDTAVDILDYKTGQAIPASEDNIPVLYRRQMAFYRALIQPVFPNRPIRATLIWTKGPVFHRLDAANLSGTLQHDFLKPGQDLPLASAP